MFSFVCEICYVLVTYLEYFSSIYTLLETGEWCYDRYPLNKWLTVRNVTKKVYWKKIITYNWLSFLLCSTTTVIKQKLKNRFFNLSLSECFDFSVYLYMTDQRFESTKSFIHAAISKLNSFSVLCTVCQNLVSYIRKRSY